MEHQQVDPGSPAVLDIGGDIGALVLVTPAAFEGDEVDLIPLDELLPAVHTAIHGRRFGGDLIFAGVYPALPAGRYCLAGAPQGADDRVEIRGGEVTSVDWRSGSSGHR